jgi:hypothetical protein
MTTDQRRLTEPLATTTWAFGLFLAATLAISVVTTIFGTGSIGGFGRYASVCATDPRAGVGVGDSPPPHVDFAATRAGAYPDLTAPVKACARHPGMGQRVPYTLTGTPSLLVWAGVFVLLWRMIRVAGRRGPFSPPVATVMRLLGWFILAGTVAAGAIEGFATDQLLNTMLVQHHDLGDTILAPIHALLPVPALAGAGLLTFAHNPAGRRHG